MPPDATVAEALARVREPQLSPAVAAQVFVARAPMATPTGRFLGMVHFQRLLREPPAQLLGGVVDNDIDPLEPATPLSEITRRMATYNLVAMPVVDGRAGWSARSPSTTCSTTYSPGDWRDRDQDRPWPEVRSGPREPPPWRSGRRRRARCGGLDPSPATAAAEAPALRPGGVRPLVRGDRPVHGHGQVHRLHDDGDLAVDRLEHARTGNLAVRPVHLHVPDPVAVAAGLLRRAADPVGAEPAGRPGPAAWRRTGGGPRMQKADTDTWPGRSPPCGSRSARWPPATSSAPSWPAWPRSWTSSTGGGCGWNTASGIIGA